MKIRYKNSSIDPTHLVIDQYKDHFKGYFYNSGFIPKMNNTVGVWRIKKL